MAIPAGLRARLQAARQVCVLTGAGVSAESGVPTFREAGTGLWAQYDPAELATPAAFRRDPALVWRWYRWRRELVSGVEPNPGHRALARLAGLVPSLTLITQNVDGLHQRAGSEGVIEFHGNLFDTRCSAGGCPVADADLVAAVPICPGCGGLLRPGVVWFGEAIPLTAQMAAAAAAESCDLFFSIGTSALVWPAAGLAASARRHGALVVEINPEATSLSPLASYCLPGKSGEILPELVDSLARN
jgi:NAD-dependent deacetylase